MIESRTTPSIFEDKRICFDVEADVHERLVHQAKARRLTLAKISRRMLNAFLAVEENPGAELILRVGDQDTILHQSSRKPDTTTTHKLLFSS